MSLNLTVDGNIPPPRWQQTECFQCEVWHWFCFKISNSWFVYGNSSDLQSNNQVAFIPQFSCMQPFHLHQLMWFSPGCDAPLRKVWVRILQTEVADVFPSREISSHILSWSSSYGLLMITTDVSSIVVNGLLLTGSSKIPVWPSKKWDAHHDTVLSP